MLHNALGNVYIRVGTGNRRALNHVGRKVLDTPLMYYARTGDPRGNANLD